MPLENHSNHQHIHKHDEKRAHAPHPSHTHYSLPLRDNEHANQAKSDAVCIQGNGSFDGVGEETFDNVVVAYWKGK